MDQNLRKAVADQTACLLRLSVQVTSHKGYCDNFVFSPLSFHVVLSLVAAGAAGPTLDQLLAFLCPDSSLNAAGTILADVFSKITCLALADGSKLGGPRLSSANGVWLAKSFLLKKLFKTRVSTVYKSDIKSVNFQRKYWNIYGVHADASTCLKESKIGDRRGTSFWHQNWGNGILKLSLPDLFSFAQNPHLSVAAFALAETATSLFKPTLPSSISALHELQHLSPLIQMVPFSSRLDTLCWQRNTGSFLVASCYAFLATLPKHGYRYTHVWSLKVPPRVKVFGWQVLNNKLATLDNIRKRGWPLPNRCTMCCAAEENAAYISFSCAYTQQALHRLGLAATAPMQEWGSARTSDNKKAGELFLIATFLIWKECCARIFRRRNSHSHCMTLCTRLWRNGIC